MFVCVLPLIYFISECNMKAAACTQKESDLERLYPLDYANVQPWLSW